MATRGQRILRARSRAFRRRRKLIKEERLKSPPFARAFADFYALCQQAINPNLSEDAVERMLVQHLLTERIFRRIFNNPDFSKRNVVAAEIEKVITELTKRAFNRDEFLKRLEPFYHAIEVNADNATEYSAKQDFLNTVYMRFFQGYSPKEADTHGIVYTPQPIVNFMVRSVEEILQKEFGRSLGDKGVHILDPFVGTGNFITRIMQEIKTTDLPYKYENELHCNEVMLLPYYIASMNIERSYYDRTDEYKPFPGICLVDTFELAEAEQASLGFMTAENAERVKRQKDSPIFVVIGNPPYNANQQNEDDNNKNRKYHVVDRRIAETYAKDSEASNRNSLSDPYVKAIRWASDRIGEQGVVALITNRSFADAKAFDAVRKHLAKDFSLIYHLNLKGDARTTGEMRRRQAGNVFDDAIRVGVGVTILVRWSALRKTPAEIYVAEVDDYLTSQQKRLYLENAGRFSATELRTATIDSRGYWQTGGANDFESLVALGDRATKGTESTAAIFEAFGGGVKTNRDAWAYNMNSAALSENMRHTIDFYNDQVSRWLRTKPSPNVDDFVTYDEKKISWSRDLKQDLERGRFAEFSQSKVRRSVYRPFTASNLFLDRVMNEEVYLIPSMFPTPLSEAENRALALTIDPQIEFSAQLVECIPCIHVGGRPSQVFPFYTYAEDGTHRRENITDWALEQFRAHYHDPSITKWASSITSTPSCTTPSTATATPPTSAANFRESRSWAATRPLTLQAPAPEGRQIIAPDASPG